LGVVSAVAACSRPQAPPKPPPVAPAAFPVGKTAIRLLNGVCLDLRRLPKPWQGTRNVSGQGLEISAPVEALGAVGFPPGYSDWMTNRPLSGPIRVAIDGVRPEEIDYAVTAPQQFEADIADGLFRPIAMWPPGTWLQAFSGPGYQRDYADRTRLTQCRDYGGDAVSILCRIVSPDRMSIYGGWIYIGNRDRMPELLSRIRHAADAMRGPCPAQ